jgi:plasmid stabilization system protein ParE
MRRYVLAPEAALDLAEIWLYIRRESSEQTADRIERVIRDKFLFLARNRNAGHRRQDLTRVPVRFYSVYSYLIIYRPESRPLEVAAILHGNQDVERILEMRL